MKIGNMISCNDDPPLHGLSSGTAGQGGFLVTKSPHRKPLFGAATFIIYGGMGVSTPIIIYEQHDFHGKCSTTETFNGSFTSLPQVFSRIR